MRVRRGTTLASATLAAAALVALTPSSASAADDDVLVEFHFQPVPNAQIAIWLEDTDGNFVQDVFVTQATGTLGIGNRPGRWDFLSSWRFPYGPRPGVLPLWAHAREVTYPKLVFHDDQPGDAESLGWHENSSSPEPYFCRPLTQGEHDTISTDTMTCPSPAVFQSDKGRYSDETSVYPPRSDLVEFEAEHDHADVYTFAETNDLDTVSKATPAGYQPELVTALVPRDLAEAGRLVARVEIHVENDQNGLWAYDREDDHYVDPRLANFGIPYLGQPSVMYEVAFDPDQAGFNSTDHYAGYSDLQGRDGDVRPPDDTISTEDGSGADRLQLFTKNERTFRFGVYSHGTEGGGQGDGSGWGSCQDAILPPMTDVEIEPVDFDRVRVHFTVPELDGEDVGTVRLFYRQGDTPLIEDNLSSAIQQVPLPEDCGDDLTPGTRTWCEVDELFGATNYQVGVRYEDSCANSSEVAADAVTTPQQEYAVVEGFCFVATAAYGAAWQGKVQALRWFRDRYLERSPMGRSMVDFYYYASPPFARMIARSEIARGMARDALGPIAEIAELATRREPEAWGTTRRRGSAG
ncbi:MAG: CFI-box-CTERM domain-containing protein [Myxococcota bacterium]